MCPIRVCRTHNRVPYRYDISSILPVLVRFKRSGLPGSQHNTVVRTTTNDGCRIGSSAAVTTQHKSLEQTRAILYKIARCLLYYLLVLSKELLMAHGLFLVHNDTVYYSRFVISPLPQLIIGHSLAERYHCVSCTGYCLLQPTETFPKSEEDSLRQSECFQ